jgi:predicted nucleic acid-binding protein
MRLKNLTRQFLTKWSCLTYNRTLVFVGSYRKFPPIFQRGIWLQSRWQISLWDAMILAAAESSGSRELLTEDLNHGQNYGQVCVINPFL